MKLLKLMIFVLIFSPVLWADESEKNLFKRFELGFHKQHSVKNKNIDCSFCHNVEHSGQKRRIILTEQLRQSTFKKPLSEICHECHRNQRTDFSAAPSACYTCHKSFEDLNRIRPQHHNIVGWRSSHATRARIEGNKCMNCHTQSQCVKCHFQRNDIKMRSHSRNFRFFHSIQARLEPHRCDTCHTKSYCSRCHLGR